MLVVRLYSLFKQNTTKKERSVLNGCRNGDGIWDQLGYYNPTTYSITICDSRIESCANYVAKSAGLNETRTTLFLRELVRVHEHSHALLHTGRLPGSKARFKTGYQNLPATVNEPLTEFIAWSVVQNVGIKFFNRVFLEVDKKTPNYYRKWRRIKRVLDKRLGSGASYIYYVPGLVHVARDGVWRDFESFLRGVKQQIECIRTRAILAQL